MLVEKGLTRCWAAVKSTCRICPYSYEHFPPTPAPCIVHRVHAKHPLFRDVVSPFCCTREYLFSEQGLRPPGKISNCTTGCSVVQLVVRWPAVWQARVQIPARHPKEVFPSERNKQWRKGERPRRMNMNECTVWMWLWMFDKDKVNKKSGSCHQTFKISSCFIYGLSYLILSGRLVFCSMVLRVPS